MHTENLMFPSLALFVLNSANTLATHSVYLNNFEDFRLIIVPANQIFDITYHDN